MVSTTSVERPESMSWAPSEAKLQFPQFWLGVKSRAPRLGQKVPPDGELQRSSPRAMKSSRTRSRQTLSRAPGSRVIRGNAYRWTLGHVCTIASSPRGAGCVRENQSGLWDVSLDANRSTCAWPNSLHINSTTSGWSLNSPGLSPCLDRMSVPILWTSGM